MRLIDADTLPKYTGMALSAVDVARAVEAAQTIDPVKHGKWIADKYTKKCSECKSTYWMREGNEWNYCPNCGPKNGGEG